MRKSTNPTPAVTKKINEEVQEFFDFHMPLPLFKAKLANVAMTHLSLYIQYREYKDHAHRLPEIKALDEHPIYADEIIEDVNILRNFINED